MACAAMAPMLDGQALSSAMAPAGMSMPVLTGDNWPFSGWRAVIDEEAEVAEDGTEAESIVEFVLVAEPV